MTKFTETGETIHAAHMDTHARKYEWKGMMAHPVTKEMMVLYECDRNSYAEIVKECCKDDIERKGTEVYHAELGDCLEADAISLYIRGKRKIKETVKEGVTGTHGARFICPRVYAISTIKTPLANLVKSIEKKKLIEDLSIKIEEK